jgi:hypothetical protein
MIRFLDKNFPKDMAEINYSLELLKEVVDDTGKEINKKVTKLTKDRKFEKVRKYLDRLEEIEKYKTKIDKFLNRIKKSKNNSKVNTEAPNYEEYRVDHKITHTLNEDFVHKRPYAFALRGEGKKVKTWTAMLRETCRLLVKKDKDIFVSFITDSEMNGKKRNYFAYSNEEMNCPLKIKVGDKDVYVESHLNANGIRDLLKKILEKYKIDIDNYNVYFRADYSELHGE